MLKLKLLWRPSLWVGGLGLRGAGLSVLSRGFAARQRARFFSVLCFWVHSQRETWAPIPCPTGSLTARVLRNSGSAPPQVSIRGLVFSYSSSSVVPWYCASSFVPARLSRAPRSGCDSPPQPLPAVFPHIRCKACLSCRLVYCL